MPARRWLRVLPAVAGLVSAVSAAVFVVALALVFWFFVRSAMLGDGPGAGERADRLVDRWTSVALWSLVVGAGSLLVSLFAGAVGRLVELLTRLVELLARLVVHVVARLVAARRASRPPGPPAGPPPAPPPG